jgi:hypothetical protein
MIVLDANILIRAVLGRQVRQLLETYAGHGIRFYAPEIAYAETAKYLPPLLRKKGKSDADLPATFAYLQSLVQPILQDSYGLFEEEARQRLRGRDGGLAGAGRGIGPVLKRSGPRTRTSSAQESRFGLPTASRSF